MLKESVKVETATSRYWETYVTDNGNSGTQNERSSKVEKVTGRKRALGSGTPGYGSRAMLPENGYFVSDSYVSIPKYSGNYQKVKRYSGYVLTTHQTGIANSDSFDKEPVLHLDEGQAWRSIHSKILNKIKDQKINVAQAFAERGQTIGLIAGNVRKLAQAITATRRGDILGAATALGVLPPRRSRRDRRRKPAAPHFKNEVSQRWLELQYGWLPLLSDIFGSIQHCAERSLKPQIERVFATQTLQDSGTLEEFLSSDERILGRSTVTTKIQLGTVVYFYVSSPLREASQLGLTNPALLAWELLPFSFVADWLLPVGNWLSTLDATLGCTFLKGSQSRKIETTTLFHTQCSGYNDEFYTVIQRKKYSSFRRDPMINFPSTRFPDFKNPVSPAHAANAVALLVQLIRK